MRESKNLEFKENMESNTFLKTISAFANYGTGTIILRCKVDAATEIRLENIRRPMEVKELLSDMIEEARAKHRVVGKEFYGGDIYMDMDGGDWDERMDGE